MFPGLDVLVFQSLRAFYSDCYRPFVHFFVTDSILLSNAGEFDLLKRETIVLCESAGQAFVDSGFNTIDVTLPEKKLISAPPRKWTSTHSTRTLTLATVAVQYTLRA